MNIYFAASVTGGRENVEIYSELIAHLKQKGHVLTEHVGHPSLPISGEQDKLLVHERDIRWLLSSDVIVAEVSTPSLGVGYELGRAVENHKKILCLYKIGSPKALSGMISGSRDLTVMKYTDLDEAKLKIDEFFEKLN